MDRSPPGSASGTVEYALRIPAATVDGQRHPSEHRAFWQVRGSSAFTCAGRILDLHTDDVLWVPSGVQHSVRVAPDSVLFPFRFPDGDIATVLTEVTRARVQEQDTIYLLALYQSQNSLIQPRADLRRQVLAILERRTLSADHLPLPVNPAALAVAEALLLNPGDDRTVSEWAAAVHTSSRTLERAFRTETGRTLGEWRLQRRMHAAAQLLRSGSAVGAVSRRVGYESPTSFARAFREFHGSSPSEFDCNGH